MPELTSGPPKGDTNLLLSFTEVKKAGLYFPSQSLRQAELHNTLTA